MQSGPGIHIELLQILPGPSLAAWHDCVRIVLAHGDASGMDAGTLQARLQGCPALLPRPLAFRFAQTGVAQVFTAIAQALQQAARHEARFASTEPLGPGMAEVVLEIMTPESARTLAYAALALTRVAFGAGDALPWSDPAWKGLRDLRPRTSQYHAKDRLLAARQMGLHCEVGGGLHRAQYLVGQGRWSQLMANAYSATTSHLGKDLAGDKIRSRTALARAGLPVPAQRRVSSASEAALEAAALGFPVVIKPSGSRASQGVFTMLCTAEVVEALYRELAQEYPEVILEKQVIGEDYRLLVIGGQCVAAARRHHPTVVGDGQSSVARLVEASNEQHGRDGIFLEPVAFDAETLHALADQNLAPDSIPGAGATVVLRRAACPPSLSEDVTDRLHPSLLRLAEQAAAAVQLDFAGIDLVCADGARPWREADTAIVEINAGPGLDINRYPDIGEPRPVARDVLRSAIAAGQSGNIPVVSVLGRYGKLQCAQAIASALRLAGLQACVADNLREPFPSALPSYQGSVRAWAASWLGRHDVEALVLPLPWSALASEGLPVQQHDVAVLVDDEGDFRTLARQLHLTDAQSRLYRLVCDASSAGVVIDGASRTLRDATAHLPAHMVIACIDANTAHEAGAWLADHRQQGGEAIAVELHADGGGSLSWIPASGDGLELWRGAAGAPLPSLARDLRALAQSLAAMRLLGHGMASLEALARLAAPTRPAFDGDALDGPWTLLGPAASATQCAMLLGRLRPPTTTGILITCEDSAPTREALRDWHQALAPYPALWQVHPTHPAPAHGTSVLQQLRELGQDPCTIQETLAGTMGPPQPEDGLRQLHIRDHLRAPVLHTMHRPESASPAEAWTPQELASVAGAVWLGRGFPRSWTIRRLAMADEPLGPGLVIVEGTARSLAAIEDIEQRTRTAFARGAQAVMSAVMPAELPRWMPLLLSDDPLQSLERLARKARSRHAGPITAWLGGEGALASCKDWARLHAFSIDPIFESPSSSPPAHHTALALARLCAGGTQQGVLLPIGWRLDGLELARPHHCIITAEGEHTLRRLGLLLPALRQCASFTLVGLDASLHDALRALLQDCRIPADRLRFAPHAGALMNLPHTP